MKFIIIIFAIFLLTLVSEGKELYILNDSCINVLFSQANDSVKSSEIEILRDSKGIVLRIFIDNPEKEYNVLSQKICKNLTIIKDFLAKIENAVIIEVHTKVAKLPDEGKIKNWELSTVIANRVEQEILKSNSNMDVSQIKSVGYGEFLPAKNTPYNGGNISNRIDIIILCNITGE